MEFIKFKEELQKRFTEISKDSTHLFEVNVDKDELWNTYLDSFPAGTNKIFRERREHDCSCCRQFIKNIGNAVVIKDNEVHTIWELNLGDKIYQSVCEALDLFVKSHMVSDVYVSKFKKIGTDFNYEDMNGKMHKWDHFFLELPDKFYDRSSRYEGDIKGGFRDTKNVFKRSLDEIFMDSIDTVLELINSNTLYKGEEWKAALGEFRKYKKEFDKLQTEKEKEKELFAWEKSVKAGGAIGRIRNHSIGTLLVNISEGMDLDLAVKKYEQIVAPSNYKRPKAIFTKKMLEEAHRTITELGYMDSLQRRFANLDDITVNNILFSNKDSAKRIGGMSDIFGDMAKDVAVSPKRFSKVEEISVKDFVENVLPTAKEVEAFVENKHDKNFVSLIAPVNSEAKTMFKWNNGMSWAYTGNITDSDITQRVKDAGGRVDGALRFSHSWNYDGMRNGSLMDLHVFMPGSNQDVVFKNGKEIHDNYGNNERVGWNHRNHIASGGSQDVDYTNVAPVGYIPVENTTFPSIDKLKEGVYIFKIHNWNLRNPTSGGFKAEIAFGGNVYKFIRREPLQNKEWVTLAKIELKNGEFKIIEMMDNDTTPIDIWNVRTNQFVPVSVICYSPNYFDEQDGIGHRHLFFMLKDCKNGEEPNGYYNEFLKNELVEHKRVFEALGAKCHVEDTEDQLSGIGFSMTKRADLVVKVKGATERVMKIKF
ncbi:hypothetical protein DS742_14370 [Lacrimispora amygdalina]|uniref:Uncharacterized protein n=1 Tax=Lacrimispora amygdalina TaxID=253257 RepID=A0A3E2NBF7_9FIRM|nr:hypothetical protein [Clostridium indicum]RFZ78294.1 hypothetical protein DS742_14370 [Clostridium indicum]